MNRCKMSTRLLYLMTRILKAMQTLQPPLRPSPRWPEAWKTVSNGGRFIDLDLEGTSPLSIPNSFFLGFDADVSFWGLVSADALRNRSTMPMTQCPTPIQFLDPAGPEYHDETGYASAAAAPLPVRRRHWSIRSQGAEGVHRWVERQWIKITIDDKAGLDFGSFSWSARWINDLNETTS